MTVNSCFFKICHSYSMQLNVSNVGEFLWDEFQRTVSKFWKESENHCLVFTSSRKRDIREFHAIVMQRRQLGNVQKAWCKGVVLLIWTYRFCRACCCHCGCCLSSLISLIHLLDSIHNWLNKLQLFQSFVWWGQLLSPPPPPALCYPVHTCDLHFCHVLLTIWNQNNSPLWN